VSKELSLSYVDEVSLSDQRVLSNEHEPRIVVRREKQLDDGTIFYSAQGQVRLERDAIRDIMIGAMHSQSGRYNYETRTYDEYTWRDIQTGLRDISYPSKRVQKIARVAHLADALSEVKDASGELAHILEHNQPYRALTTTIPALTYGEAHEYSVHSLELLGTQHLALMMKGIGVDQKDGQLIDDMLTGQTLQSEEIVRDLIELSGMDGDLIESIQNRAFFAQINPRLAVEIIERFKQDHFSVFPRAASFDGKKFIGGAKEPETYIFDEDVPLGLERARTNEIEDLLRQKEVIVTVGPTSRDRDKKRDLERRAVTFRTHAPLYVALGKIAWKYGPDPEWDNTLQRHFVFPTSYFETTSDSSVARPSSVVGAATAASVFGQEIDYEKALHDAYTKQRSHGYYTSKRRSNFRHSSGALWPLFAHTYEKVILDNDYFKAIEDRLQ
jgi:hypothetical protein